MKEKCKILYVSIGISVISLLVLIIVFFIKQMNYYTWLELLYDIYLGLFGSSFVVVLVTTSEYRVAKRTLLEKIWGESLRMNNQLYKIEPLISNIDIKLMSSYLNEKSLNEIFPGAVVKQEKYDELYNYLLEYYANDVDGMDEMNKKTYIDNSIEKETEKLLNKLEKIIDEYIRLFDYSFSNYNNLLGELMFFTGKKNHKKVYSELYEPLLNMYNTLRASTSYHCKLYREKEANNIGALICIIVDNQSNLFKFEKNKTNKGTNYIIHYEFCYNMELMIEKFRANVIYKCEEDKIEEFYHGSIRWK